MSDISQKQKREKLGFLLLISSLVFYFIIKIPFNLSVLCSNTNEGFYFIFGQHFLNGGQFQPPGRLYVNLFFLVYAFVLKLFGFGTLSILAVHLIHTFITLLNGTIIFFLLKKLILDSLYSALAVLFWIIFLLTPIGHWGFDLEYGSFFALEAECFIVFFSMLSFYLIMKVIENKKGFAFAFLSGLCAAVCISFKGSGTVFSIALFCWTLYLFCFERRAFNQLKHNICFIFLGLFLGFLLFNLGLHLHGIDLKTFWGFYFQVGSYSTEFIKSQYSFLKSIFNFMTRHTDSLNNFFLFLSGFISVIWCLTRNFFVKDENYLMKLICPLLAIWGFGNISAVIAPGGYGAYYYLLVWPAFAMFFAISLRDIFNTSLFKKPFLRSLIFILISIFFLCRISISCQPFVRFAKSTLQKNLFLQPESFQDPVKDSINVNNRNINRPHFLVVADLINNFLPEKKDTAYIVNLRKDKQFFPITSYIYMKRMPSTIVVSDYFYYKNFLKERLDALKEDLIKNPPKVIILPAVYYMRPWQIQYLSDFIKWFDGFVEDKYIYKITILIQSEDSEEKENFQLYERKDF